MPLVKEKPRTMEDGTNIISFTDSVGTNYVTYTFEKSQESITIANKGIKPIQYSVGTYTDVTLNPGDSNTVNTIFTSFDVRSVQGVQQFDIRADEEGTVGISSDAVASLDVKVDNLTTQLAQKAQQIDLDTTNQNVTINTNTIAAHSTQIAANTAAINGIGNLKFIGIYATLSALQTAYPTGTTGIALITADGFGYYWNGSAWTKGAQFQSTGIAKASIKKDLIASGGTAYYNTDFLAIGKNLYNKATCSADNLARNTGTGLEYSASGWVYSDYIPCKTSTSYKFLTSTFPSVVFFDNNYNYISGLAVSNKTFTTPSNAAFFVANIPVGNKNTEQIEEGTVSTTYEDFGVTFKSFKPKSVPSTALSPLITYDAYPFQSQATFNNETQALEVKKAIKKIELYGADKTKKYCLGFLMRNATTMGTRIYIYECNADGTVANYVCLTSISGYVEPSGIDEFVVNEANGSKISAKVWIDWSQITNGANYDFTHFDKSGLDYRTYISTTDGFEIKLPPIIPAIIGKEINIYFDNVVVCGNINNYNFDVTCTVGKQQNERWTFTPTTAGTYTLTVDVYKDFKIVGTASTSIVVKADTVGNAVNKKVLFLGDSTTQAGAYTAELLNLFNNDVMDITLLGTRGTAPNLHEGRGGWAAYDYVNSASLAGVTNAFWNGSAFDFSYYMTQQGYTGVDVVAIHLGINDVFGQTSDTVITDIAAILGRFDTILNSIKTYNSSVKVAFMVTIPPSKFQDSFGANYGAGQNRWRYKRNNFLLVKSLIDKYKGREAEGIYLIPINVNLDTENNMETETVAVNSRNTKTVVRQANGVHPAIIGYNQMADVIYYWLKGQES